MTNPPAMTTAVAMTAAPAAANAPSHASEAAAGSKPGAGPPPAPGLYLVATPIGNLGDITLRALDLLASADVIACEDTRVTAHLLTHFGLRTPLLAYHDHNAARARPGLLRRLKAGERVALVSDAGTPLISDPGYKLVRAALDQGCAVTALPGACSILAALVLSGLPSDRFFFAGFLPPKPAARRAALAAFKSIPASLVFLESPRRLAESLSDMALVLGPRRGAVARELTKRFEEIRRSPLGDLIAHYRAWGPPKGEVVVVLGPPDDAVATTVDLDRLLRQALAQDKLKEAVAKVAAATGAPRRAVYARALALKAEEEARGPS